MHILCVRRLSEVGTFEVNVASDSCDTLDWTLTFLGLFHAIYYVDVFNMDTCVTEL